MPERKKKRKSSIPENETKEERFIRVATPRVNRAIKYINMLGECAGSSYEYTEVQLANAVSAIKKALDATTLKLQRKGTEPSEFTF